MPTNVFRDPPGGVVVEAIKGLFTSTDLGGLKFDRASYKRSVMLGSLYPFLAMLGDYYYPSTRYYVEREPTYRRVSTVVRQVLDATSTPYTYRTVYESNRRDVVILLSLGSGGGSANED